MQQLRLMVQSTRGKQFVCSRFQLLCYTLISWLCVYSHQWINKDSLQTRNVKVDVQVITFSLLCEIYSSGFFEALDWKRILCTLKRYYVSQIICWHCRFHFCYMTNNIPLTCTLYVYFARSISLKFICKTETISCGIRQFKRILELSIKVSEEIWRKIKYLLR